MRIDRPDLVNTKFPIFVGHTVLSNVATASFSVRDYPLYFFVLQSVVPDTDGVQLAARFSVNGSVLSGASDYAYSNFVFRSGATASNADAANSFIQMSTITGGIGSATNEGLHSLIWFHQAPPQASLTYQNSYRSAAAATCKDYGAGRLVTNANIDAVQFLFSSGNLESGTITCFGME